MLVQRIFKKGARVHFNKLMADSRRISAFALAGKVMVFSAIFSFLPFGLPHANAQKYDTAIKFDQANPLALSLNDNMVRIELGESIVTQEERENNARFAYVQPKEAVSESREHRDPAEFRPVYMAAAQQFGIPWQLIEAVHEVESGKSGSTMTRSYAGATGPMQFMPGTWRAYEVDGNGDGVADITDVTDAIYTAARYLANSGADEGRIDDALFNYNHSTAYVNKVKTIAYEIGL